MIAALSPTILTAFVMFTPNLGSQKPKDGWVHWFFRMDDNPSLTPEKKANILANVPEGTKQWKSKILGLRGRSEGLVYEEFTDDKVIPIDKFKWLPNEMVAQIICGLDSGLNADATALVTGLITTAGRLLVIPSFYYLPNQFIWDYYLLFYLM